MKETRQNSLNEYLKNLRVISERIGKGILLTILEKLLKFQEKSPKNLQEEYQKRVLIEYLKECGK